MNQDEGSRSALAEFSAKAYKEVQSSSSIKASIDHMEKSLARMRELHEIATIREDNDRLRIQNDGLQFANRSISEEADKVRRQAIYLQGQVNEMEAVMKAKDDEIARLSRKAKRASR